MKTKDALLLIIGLKALFILVISLCPYLFTDLFNAREYWGNFHWPPNMPPTALTCFQTWDSQHYLFLSQFGYQKGFLSTAFYPLWPALIAILSTITINHLLSALILSNALSAAAFLILHREIRNQDKNLADLSLMFLLCFPGALFFTLPYTESLFLFLSVVFFFFLRREKFILAGLVSFFLPLTRVVGAFAILPLIFSLFKSKKSGSSVSGSDWASLIFVPLGILSYFCIIQIATGDFLSGIRIQSDYTHARSVASMFDVVGIIKNYLQIQGFHGFEHSFFDRLWFTVFLLSLPGIWRYNKALFLYALPLGLFPIMTGFMSFTRYLSVIFPVFISLAIFFSHENRRVSKYLVLTFMFIFQIIFLILHSSNNWFG